MSNYYSRLSPEEREEMSLQLGLGKSFRWIARQLDRSPSTISREYAQNSCSTGYRAVTAQKKSMGRWQRSVRKLETNSKLKQQVISGLRKQWSPQQISASLATAYPEDGTMRVCAETIYTYLYVLPRGGLRKELLSHLRQHHKKRRSRGKGADRRGQIPEMISIEERPQEVEARTMPGHWEGDLIIKSGDTIPISSKKK